jgi:hypothetical protein
MTVGNHDNRWNFASRLPTSVDSNSGFADHRFELDCEHVGLVLDTWQPGAHSGMLSSVQLEWLSAQLQSTSKRAIIFMHHAPFKIGLKRLDEMMLVNDRELWNTISPFRRRIRHLFFGHLHRIVSGSWRGIPFTAVPPVAHQGLVEFNATVSRSTISEPFYAIILLQEDNVIVHSKQVSGKRAVIGSSTAGSASGA